MAMLMSILMFSGLTNVKAAQTAHVSISSASANVGDEVTITITASSDVKIELCDLRINYDSSILQYVKGFDAGGGGTGRLISPNATSFDVVFKTINPGTATISVDKSTSYTSSADEDYMSLTTSSGSVNVKAPASYSSDNTLKSLQISPGTLSPAFSPDRTTYNATVDADVTELFKECKKLNEGVTDKTKKITINTIMLKIICEGLKAAPKMNTHLEFNRKLVRGKLIYFDHIDISMPMILPSGVMMTVNMHDMGDKTLTQMTEAINNTAMRAKGSDMNEVMYEVSLDNTLTGLKKGKFLQTIHRLVGSKTGKHKVKTLSGQAKKDYYSIPITKRLTKHDIEQGTTTISNLGSVYREQKGMCALLEIIPPQTTAFAINAAQKRPTVVTDENGNDKIEIRLILPITIAIDHRALDYGDVVPFMRKLDEIFDNPSIIQSWK